jgi:hypothetical protein
MLAGHRLAGRRKACLVQGDRSTPAQSPGRTRTGGTGNGVAVDRVARLDEVLPVDAHNGQHHGAADEGAEPSEDHPAPPMAAPRVVRGRGNRGAEAGGGPAGLAAGADPSA